MSGKYVPPSRRNNRAEPVQPTLTPEYFPHLSTRQSLVAPPQLSKQYSALATEWNEKEEEERTQKNFQTELDKRNRQREEASRRNVVYLHRDYHGPDEYIYSGDEPVVSAPKVDPDGWQVVEKKPKREFTQEEQMERKQRFMEAEEQQKKEDDSVWGSSSKGVDEWGYRDRRAAS
jgi:hypothetical protein